MVRLAFALTTAGLVSSQDLFLEQRAETVIDATGNMHSCLKSCQKTDDKKHFKTCERDGQTDCSKSKCCEFITDTCFVKNAYWAACTPSCKKGVPDALGEKWDCTALSPSGCHHLTSCVEKCAPGLASTANNATFAEELVEIVDVAEPVSEKLTAEELRSTGDPPKCNGGSKDICKQSCKQIFTNVNIEHVCEVMCDKNCPDAPPKKCPSTKGLGACVRHCSSTSNGPDHGSHCEEDGRSSCLSSKCCKSPGDKCYTKSPYWAACIGECKPGKKNKVDNQIWDCEELKPKKVCDPYKYRTCIDTCVAQC